MAPRGALLKILLLLTPQSGLLGGAGALGVQSSAWEVKR